MRVYLASSWRNPYYLRALADITAAGHEVYDWRNHPAAFNWKQVDEDWENWSMDNYLKALNHPVAEAGFASDARELDECDVCVLLLPCGRSAHTELGYMLGAGKPGLVVLMDHTFEPELMYKLCGKGGVVKTIDEAIEWLNGQKT